MTDLLSKILCSFRFADKSGIATFAQHFIQTHMTDLDTSLAIAEGLSWILVAGLFIFWGLILVALIALIRWLWKKGNS